MLDQQPVKIVAQDRSPSIFISYCHADISLARQLDDDLQILGLQIVRDERSVRYTEDLPSYMKSIRLFDFALVLVSDAFLRSAACMNEVLEFFKDEDHRQRILPVIVQDYNDSGTFKRGACIYNAVDIAEYVKYWEERLDVVREAISRLDPSNTTELNKEARLTKHICDVIGQFIDLLRRTKHVTFSQLLECSYAPLLERLNMGAETLDNVRKAHSLYSQAIAQQTCEGRLRFLDRALAIYPDYAAALNKKGQVLDEQHDYDGAIRCYDSAIEAAPLKAAGYISRSYAYIRKGELKAALDDLNRALELEPCKEGYNNRADVLRRLNRFEDALVDVNQALASDPEFDLAHATLAEIEAARGDRDGFYTHLEKAVECGYPLHKYSFDGVYDDFEEEDRFRHLVEISEDKNTRFI